MGASHRTNTRTRIPFSGSISSCRLENCSKRIGIYPNLSGVTETMAALLRQSFGSFTINSIRPENLQTIWVSRFKDWGVQPVRLPAQDPFCGVGFITTDGPVWEHSRALLKPSFNRANMTDLPTLERYLRLVIDHVPKDGSTIDLQPLFFNLVRSRGISGVKKYIIDIYR